MGDIKIHEGGGYGTETGFVTSHNWCSKYQEVNLLDYFLEEYLDTAPEIQVQSNLYYTPPLRNYSRAVQELTI